MFVTPLLANAIGDSAALLGASSLGTTFSSPAGDLPLYQNPMHLFLNIAVPTHYRIPWLHSFQ